MEDEGVAAAGAADEVVELIIGLDSWGDKEEVSAGNDEDAGVVEGDVDERAELVPLELIA